MLCSGHIIAGGYASDSKVPVNRLSRFGNLASLAGRVAGGMVAEGARQLAQGNRPTKAGMLLTTANVRRVADKLAHLRGAAMKVGQLLSMDAGDMLPPELSDILARRLRDAGTALSLKQDYWHTPPVDALFLHRKIAGLYLLAAKLNAGVNVRGLLQPYLAPEAE